jgi:hypothetical protein
MIFTRGDAVVRHYLRDDAMEIRMRVVVCISVLSQHWFFSELVLSSDFFIDMAQSMGSAPRRKLKLYIPGLD